MENLLVPEPPVFLVNPFAGANREPGGTFTAPVLALPHDISTDKKPLRTLFARIHNGDFLGQTAIWAIFEFYNHVCGSRNSSCRAVASQLAGERF